MHPVAGSEDTRLSVAAAYDTIAAEYDEQVRGDMWMRRVLHAHYARVFAPGERVLDVGCGTGLDTLALAALGMRVVGVDASPGMVTLLRDKVQHRRLAHLIDARVIGIERLPDLGPERFDGIVSGFASLSSLPDLRGFGVAAADLVRPGGRVILHLLNRFSLWECLGYLARRDWRAASRAGRQRARQFTIGGQSVSHSLYFAAEAYRRFFAAAFTQRAAYALGALRPPHTVTRLPAAVIDTLEWLDLCLGGWPLVRNCGRFFVLDLERRPT